VKRRDFLKTSGAVLSLPLVSGNALAIVPPNKPIRPKVLRPGDTVGLITPASPVGAKQLADAEQRIKSLGLRSKIGMHVGKPPGGGKSTIQANIDDLHSMVRDAEVQAIFCMRGGTGSIELLDRIDYDLIRRHPKIFLGFSDITHLHLAIHRYSRLVTFHGPNIASFLGLPKYTLSYLRKAIFDNRPIGKVSNPTQPSDPKFPAYKIRTIGPGKASGRLIGGNLTAISYTMGTPYEIETRDSILFLEAVNQEPDQVRTMLNQMRLAKKFDGVAGIIFGACTNCITPAGTVPDENAIYSTDEVLDDMLGKLHVPVLSGLAIGHIPDQMTVPLGVMATLDADIGTLTITEAGVV
jgi:muramoyltetrapeptide carboxypeptidase